ncbi:MAG TPA: geranylgeranyl reductase family protein [Acidimicrobiales bacterium]|nr:geranylgeranyl reductase family protein [Acidimicrobiales bacterium]
MTRTCDVLVVGGGPAGAATGYWLAEAGHDVLVVEKKTFPRDKTCGDGLTPRAVKQLADMGLEDAVARDHHRFDGLRAVAHGISLELRWPEHPVYPSHGYVVRRRDLDRLVAEHAVKAGATVWQGAEAVAPVLDRGLVRGASIKTKESGAVEDVRARYVVVADGANSRFGRALGTARDRTYPQGMAIRGYYESPMHDDPWIESALDVRDRAGNSLPGYGWIFPVGDGTVNVGIGLLSTFRDWKSVNTSHLMEEWAATAPAYWGLSEETRLGPPTGGRLPMAGSVGPKSGPSFLVVGDAAGQINPFNGEGIDYAYETGRLAADVLDEAITTGSGLALQRYEQTLDREFALYYKVARLFVQLIGRPALMRELTRIGMHSRTLMEWVLAIMANLLKPEEVGPAEAVYKTVAALVRFAPEPRVRGERRP